MMKAYVKTRYGGPEVLQLQEVAIPVIKDEEVLVKVMANSANPADWHIIRGKPFLARFSFGLFRPKYKIAGADFAGEVIKAGKNTLFKEGDRVLGSSLTGGAFAQYIAVSGSDCGHIPAGGSYKDMACLPIAAVTALQALVNHGKIQTGESVLINGSSGGVGHFAVQIARIYGAHVTAVCSSANVDFVKQLGAHEVIAYDRTPLHTHTGKYDLVLDTNGNLTYRDFTRLGKRGVLVGFTSFGRMLSVSLRKVFGRFRIAQFTAENNTADLETLAGMVAQNTLKVHIEKQFSFERIPEAIGYIEAMRTRGKVSMLWEESA